MKQFKFREIEDGEQFDPTCICSSVPFTQAGFYGDWQRSLGRIVKRFLVYNKEEIVAYFQVIKYPLLRGKSYLYIPYGPVIKNSSKDFFISLKNELVQIAKEDQAIFVRLDFTPLTAKDVLSEFFKYAPLYTYHSAYFQPRHEWFLGLEKSEGELFDAMHKDTRYAIRLAIRKGITTEIITENFGKYFESFYDLMFKTSKRNGFSLHEKDYYRNIFENLSQIPDSFLSIARYDKKILIVDLIIVYGSVANHVFGGSSDEYRSLCPSYLSKQSSIFHAKKLGCTDFNFGGISTNEAVYKGWEGLTTFKKRFGGREVRHSDFFDIVVNPFWYHLYNLRKRLKRIFI